MVSAPFDPGMRFQVRITHVSAGWLPVQGLIATQRPGAGLAWAKPSDLVLSALVRARFCELLAPQVRHGESDLFLVGISH